MFRYFHFLCFFVVSVSTLRSDVIYSTFGPGQSFSNNELDISGTNSSAGGYQAVAQMFQPSEAATLTTISVPLSFFSGVNSFTIAIALDESGLPGTTLESFAVLNVPSFRGAVEDVVSTMTPVLSSASTYWLEVVPGDLTTSGGWFSRDPFPNYGSVNFAVNHGSGWSIKASGRLCAG